MALISEGQDYSSPSKKIKLDQTQHLSNSSLGIGLQSFDATLKDTENDVSESSVATDILNGVDSGYNDLSSFPSDFNSCELNTSVLDSSLQSSNTSDDGGGQNFAEDEHDEVSSTVSNISNLSGLSDFSGQDWKPASGPMSWVQKHMLNGTNPRSLLNQLVADDTHIPPTMNDLTLWKIIVSMLSDPPRRQKLTSVNTLADVVHLLHTSSKIMILTGAGVSVSCGIPDFRSRNGIYSRLALDFPDLPDPQAMFDIQYFCQDPRPFFKFAREIYPGQFKPSPCHRFIKILEKQKKLLRNYTQNIDTLEQVAGIENVIECHGSFATASCMQCKHKVTADDIREDIFAQRIPLCPKCTSGETTHSVDAADEHKDSTYKSILKPDIVFFGEGLSDVFHNCMAKDKDECDLLIVIGSSLKVRPVALIPNSIPSHVPQILINREPLLHFNFDVELLGEIDVIINQLCHLLGEGWNDICWQPPLVVTEELLSNSNRCSSDKHKADFTENGNTYVSSSCNVLPVNENATVELPESILSIQDTNDGEFSQMSTDGISGTSADDDNTIIAKERHMSVDSSTRDSGLGFSADSPAGSNHILNDYYNRSLDPNDNLVSLYQDCIPNRLMGVVSMSPCSYQVDMTIGSTNVHISEDSNKNPTRRISVDSAKDDGIGTDVGNAKKLRKNKKNFRSLKFSKKHPKNDTDLDAIGMCWQPKHRQSIAARLPDNSYYFVEPNRYIFPGADVFSDDSEDTNISSSSGSSSSDSSESDSDSSDESIHEDVGCDEPTTSSVSDMDKSVNHSSP